MLASQCGANTVSTNIGTSVALTYHIRQLYYFVTSFLTRCCKLKRCKQGQFDGECRASRGNVSLSLCRSLPVRIYVCVFVWVFVCLPACLSVCLSYCLSVCLSFSMSFCLSGFLPDKQKDIRCSPYTVCSYTKHAYSLLDVAVLLTPSQTRLLPTRRRCSPYTIANTPTPYSTSLFSVRFDTILLSLSSLENLCSSGAAPRQVYGGSCDHSSRRSSASSG